MSKTTAARSAALSIMRAIRSGELADRAFARLAEEVPARDRAWLHELVYGTLRLRGRLDYVLGKFVKKGVASLDDDVLDILRLAAYQLLEMDSVPAYAAVSQAVELTKATRKRSASGLVNGVLQSLQRARPIAPPADDVLERLADWGAHPRWLIERWLAQLGSAAVAQLVDADNTRPETFIRPLGISLDEAIARGAAAGMVLEPVAHAPDALRMREGRVADVLAAVPATVQDPAAGLIARYAAPEGGVVADLCAAPGGKALALADMVAGKGVVMAGDVAAARLERAVENARRIGALPVQFLVADARRPALREADVVLLDVPCTGTGTFRRHPDGKWRVQPNDLFALVALQRDILDSACAIVKLGGILVYSTCSLEMEENQQQVTEFLDRHPNFLRRPPASWADTSTIDEVGNLVVWPHVHGFDGAFATRLERVA
ncbi:MAG TPA: 16S rRNA (cytosine(967)-C(5))-methyltransferase RsmB [Longimicrobiales bacterium]